MIDWKALCEESHAHAKAKGFLDGNRTFFGELALMHSELSEALEEYRNHKGLTEIYFKHKDVDVYTSPSGVDGGTVEEWLAAPVTLQAKLKPEGIPIELADTIIRIAQFCGTQDIHLAGAIQDMRAQPDAPVAFEEFISEAHYRISTVHEYWREKRVYNEYGFARGVLLITSFCRLNGIDIEQAIKIKAAFNKTRPVKHGDKKI